ncbi:MULTISPECIES: hypothetical protein [Flavobacterium]|uniref:hypothetical protein n=1 Tax=Flavobacterium TaxID=237 RepID=UPI0015AEBF13|nr:MULTISPECIES: hypothetical protein [Flavobacterium]
MNKSKLTLVILMMLTAWHASSQTAIPKDSVVISKEVARKVLIDLADYDRLRENKVETNLEDCIGIQKEKDVLISYMAQQNKLYGETLLLTEKQLKIRDEQLRLNKGGSGKSLLFGVAGFAVGLVLGGLLIQ